MKKVILLYLAAFGFLSLHAQKIVENPVNVSSNIPGKITKIELTDKETILHFSIKRNGGWFAVPDQTYIQSSRKEGEKLFVTKTDGIKLNERITATPGSPSVRYKLYFPPIGKEVDKINYGEANKGGNWFIYKIDLNTSRSNVSLIENGVPLTFNLGDKVDNFTVFPSVGRTKGTFASINNKETLLPEDLPKEFFGNWYDKYGTLMLIATPQFVVSNIKVSFYRNIHKTEDNKYSIEHSGGHFKILHIDDKTMSLGGQRLQTFYKEPEKKKIPNDLKGVWKNDDGEITIDNKFMHFKGGKNSFIFGSKELRIVHTAHSMQGDIYWFIIYNQGNYYIYIANKSNGEYVLSPKGWKTGGYKKVSK